VARSQATTVEQYLAELQPAQREIVVAVRALIRKHLPKGYAETMSFGMIGYGIPLLRYPDTYNGQPLSYVALAAQKNAYSLYLMGCYLAPEQERELRAAFTKAGKKLDMGKSCVRFKALDDLVLPAIGKLIGSMSVDDYITYYEAARRK
jgi:hypothetical protein